MVSLKRRFGKAPLNHEFQNDLYM